MDNLVGEISNFELYSESNRQPVKVIAQNWSDVIIFRASSKNASSTILNPLQFIDAGLWEAGIENITVVRAAGYECL